MRFQHGRCLLQFWKFASQRHWDLVSLQKIVSANETIYPNMAAADSRVVSLLSADGQLLSHSEIDLKKNQQPSGVELILALHLLISGSAKDLHPS